MAKGQDISEKKKEKKIESNVQSPTNTKNKKKFTLSFLKWTKPKNTGSLKTSSKLKGMEITSGSSEPQVLPVETITLNPIPLKSAFRDPNKKREKKKVRFAADFHDDHHPLPSSVRLSPKVRLPKFSPSQTPHFERNFRVRAQRERVIEPHPKINYTEFKPRKPSDVRELAFIHQRNTTNRRGHQKRHSMSIHSGGTKRFQSKKSIKRRSFNFGSGTDNNPFLDGVIYSDERITSGYGSERTITIPAYSNTRLRRNSVQLEIDKKRYRYTTPTVNSQKYF
eukprot:TRINITY_DN9705_c0_g1_i1.p1 TRINITY_DN9705_c0_g1~~TRINITY_DN9705_c0_g1_i1.p1  ORF type:complete len:292 (+),score=54.62 TRINITY_DN9705_c0_g1_i1:37-876(+)